MAAADERLGHEQELCEGLVQLLEEDLAAPRAEVTYPERDRSGPPVEMRLRIGVRRFAIEHTLIEPFPAAIRTGKEYGELVAEIASALDGDMPKPGTYQLILPEHPTAGRPRKTHPALRAKIIAWAREAAASLHDESPDRVGPDRLPHGYEGRREAVVDGLALALVRRVHWSEAGRHDGRLFAYRLVEGDVETRRRARIATALEKKLPKLAACASEGDETILILEYRDPALTNQILVFQALEAALKKRTDWPSHIFLADTICDGQWSFLQPLKNGRLSIDMPFIDVPGAPAAAPS